MGDVLKFGKPKKEANFKIFAGLIMSNDVKEATSMLRDLLEIDYELATHCTNHVLENYKKNPSTLMAMMLIRDQIEEGNMNAALAQIQSTFDLLGPDSLKALSKIKTMISNS